ncbi:MAG: Hsp20/alpha crystallin family protein [Anaerolineae bacterium]|nr:Hsp20/alpha crystallin family protein [Anaerolineae bacterium]
MQRKDSNRDSLRETQTTDQQWVIMVRQSNLTFSPPMDVIELAEKILVRVEIAGMRASDLNISLLDRHLVISGTREKPQHINPAYHQVEIGYGEFRIELSLPSPIERDLVTANYDAGFLQIDLPRKNTQQIHVVDVSGVE